MKCYLNKLALFIVLSLIPTVAFAEEAKAKAPDSFPVILVVFMAIFIAWIFYIAIGRRAEVKRNRAYLENAANHIDLAESHMKRQTDHMAIMESRSKEIVELLKSIDRKMSEPGE